MTEPDKVADTAAVVESDRVTEKEHVEQARADLAGEVETERSDRAVVMAEGVETTRVAVEVEVARVAADVELARVAAARDLEIFRQDMAATLEADRKRHNLDAEERIRIKARQVSRKFLAIYLVTILIFVFLAWRSEVNDNGIADNTRAIDRGLYEACQGRSTAAIRYNEGVTNLVAFFATIPSDPPLTPEQQETRATLIRDAFYRPVEDCGPTP